MCIAITALYTCMHVHVYSYYNTMYTQATQYYVGSYYGTICVCTCTYIAAIILCMYMQATYIYSIMYTATTALYTYVNAYSYYRTIYLHQLSSVETYIMLVNQHLVSRHSVILQRVILQLLYFSCHSKTESVTHFYQFATRYLMNAFQQFYFPTLQVLY